ncbi:MAG TPA: hypothetical protein VFL51_10865 [Pseudolabrys sp.]|nr:hypothetical protein [Pseudolabrys sp.]
MTDIPQAALHARQMYLDNAPVRRILAETGLAYRKMYLWLDGGPMREGGRPLLPVPRRRPAVRRRAQKSERAALVSRMMRAAERQVSEIEERLAAPQRESGGREHDARLMAVLVKTLRELTALDALHEDAARQAADDNERLPRDIDEIHRSLSRKLEALVAEEEAEISRDHRTS